MATNVSPSAQKVEDFLSKISQLSQDRLRENQKTRRDLQSEIDSLRLNQPLNHQSQLHNGDFGVSQLTFNRSARSQLIQKWSDTPPALPSRPKLVVDSEISGEIGDRNVFQSYKPDPSFSTHENDERNFPPLPQRPQSLGLMKTPEKPMKPEKPRSLEKLIPTEKPQKPLGLSTHGLEKAEGFDTPPELPKQASEQGNSFPGLINPVARRDVPKKPRNILETHESGNFFNFTARKSNEGHSLPKKMASFNDMENKIRSFGTSESSLLGSSSSTVNTEVSGASAPIKSTKPSWTPALKPAKPIKPAKPTLKSFETQNTELLKDQIKRLSPTKTHQNEKQCDFGNVPGFSLTKDIDSTPKSEKEKFNSLKPMKPMKPKALVQEPEALLALGKLRKLQPKSEEAAAIPEALQKFQNLKSLPPKPIKPVIPRKTNVDLPEKRPITNQTKENLVAGDSQREVIPKPTSTSQISEELNQSIAPKSAPSKTDFHAHLASIIRSLTAPAIGVAPDAILELEAPKAKVLPRPNTLPESTKTTQKLTHPNKSRAKGPKRKLPKLGTKPQVSLEMNSKNTSVIAENVSGNMTNGNDESKASTNFQELKESSEPRKVPTKPEFLAYNKPRSMPPPKAKKPNFQPRPARNFSGEVFL